MNKERWYILLCSLIGLVSGCKNPGGTAAAKTVSEPVEVVYDTTNKNGVLYDSAYKITKSLSDSTYEEQISLVYQRYKVEVTSVYLDDSVARDESNLFNPVCLSQRLSFYEDHVLKKTQAHPVRTITQKVSSGKRVEMLEDVITDIGVIRGKRGLLVVTQGYGECSSCSEFYGVYSMQGDRLWYVYRTKQEVYKEEGNAEKVFSDYGANEEEMDRSTYSRIVVY